VSRTVRGLAAACHPLPAAAVTSFATALALGAGIRPGPAVLLAAAVLCGQLSIGWCNDAVDAPLDAAAGRTRKPLVAGLVPRRTVWWAAVVAAGACVPLSFSLGAVPGALHLLLVASGWAYDLGLKRTALSPLPYLVAFGVLPAVAATAAGVAPSALLVAGSGLLATGAHFANTVPDAAADALTDVRGLPQRIGPRRSRHAAAGGVVLACLVLLLGAFPALPGTAVALLVAAALLGAAGAAAPAATSFRLVLAAAGTAVAGVVAAGPALLG
jgi:4-hydroxybenzoate polyprenyltransferase